MKRLEWEREIKKRQKRKNIIIRGGGDKERQMGRIEKKNRRDSEGNEDSNEGRRDKEAREKKQQGEGKCIDKIRKCKGEGGSDEGKEEEIERTGY